MPSRLQAATTFLVDGALAIDAGSLAFALTPAQQARVRDVVVTHSHMDHIASLPIFVAEQFTARRDPIVVHATATVLESLERHVFNGRIWPRFQGLRLPRSGAPCLRFSRIEPRRPFRVAGLRVTAIPVNHTVPTVGLLLRDSTAAVLFTSDTASTDEIWEVANRTSSARAIFVDVSFPDELAALARDSRHLTPAALGRELEKLRRPLRIYAVHVKPQSREQVERELAALRRPGLAVARIGRDYRW
jgi:ribonuclease BN (tRNA processing enzyme)